MSKKKQQIVNFAELFVHYGQKREQGVHVKVGQVGQAVMGAPEVAHKVSRGGLERIN